MVVLYERRTGLRSSGTNMLFWLGMLGYGTVKLRSLILISKDDVSAKCCCCGYCFYFIVLLLLLLHRVRSTTSFGL